MDQELTNPTMPAMLYEASLTHPDNPALVHSARDMRLTYREFAAVVAKVARGLYALGIRPEDRVVIWGPNAPEWIIAQWAIPHLDAAWVPLDPKSTPEQAAYVLKNCQAQAVIMADDLWPVLQQVEEVARPEIVVCWNQSGAAHGGANWADMLNGARSTAPGVMAKLLGGVKRHHLAAVVYTSGTTGQPKGVMLNHEALTQKCLMATERLGLDHQDRLALFFPLFHMFGNTCIAMAGMVRGATLVMPEADFEPESALNAMAAEKCSAVFGTPAMLSALLDHPARQGLDLSSLRTGIIGGAQCPLELMKRVVEELGAAQAAIGYGCTETASWITLTSPDDPLELRASTVGTRLRGVEIMIADLESGEALDTGQPGDVCSRGWLMNGYLNQPEKTAEVLDRQGWYHTGDMGYLDDKGYLRILGRLKDAIVKQGRCIGPVEVESVICQIPQVAEVQVFGVPLGDGGEEVAAWLRLKPGADLDPEAVLAYCRKHLEQILVPDKVRVVDEFPLTNAGKVQKSKLREMALALRQQG
jgi:fatty-acyl-CoA synthase